MNLHSILLTLATVLFGFAKTAAQPPQTFPLYGSSPSPIPSPPKTSKKRR
ncbi:MAG: hypothetical protein IPN76_21220 [Saprospiraceae bacterium]|nr:hypothetical protein [Saprospiraceae bacterium]